jgi:hypothetical protein
VPILPLQCTFTDCAVTVDVGGAFHVQSDGQLLIDTCQFSGNIGNGGGALSLSTSDRLDKKTVQFDITRSNFDNNTATSTSNGNAIIVLSGVLNMTNSTVRNHVYKQKAVVATKAGATYMSDSVFHDNSGGVIFTDLSDSLIELNVQRSNFTNNDAQDLSAAIETVKLILE